ncbi:MAG TPA: hypothetical protein VGC66_01720 [Pyrinomonadaceae bacterium]|jgi:hypothetical protein
MTDESSLVGDSSMHTGNEPAPEGGFYRHRLTIRFTNGETFVYTVAEPLHAEDIAASARFAVISTYLCEKPEDCHEIVLLNLNDVSYIRTEHITNQELEKEELTKKEAAHQQSTIGTTQRLSRIGFI